MYGKMYKRKGLSAVVATIIMLSITIALTGAAYMYISGFFAGKTENAFQVINSWDASVTIRNVGTTEISNLRGDLDNNPVDLLMTPISPGGTAEIKPIASLSKGMHTLRICSSSMCNVAYLNVLEDVNITGNVTEKGNYLLDKEITWGDGTTEHVQIDNDHFFILNGTKSRLVGMVMTTQKQPYGDGMFYDPENLANYDKELSYLQSIGVRIVSVDLLYVRWYGNNSLATEESRYKSLLDLLYQHKMLAVPQHNAKWMWAFDNLTNPDFYIYGSGTESNDTMSVWANRWSHIVSNYSNVVAITIDNELDYKLSPPTYPYKQNYTAEAAGNYLKLRADIARQANVPIIHKLMGNKEWGDQDVKLAALNATDFPAFDIYAWSPQEMGSVLNTLITWINNSGYPKTGWWCMEVNYGSGAEMYSENFDVGYIDAVFNQGATIALLFPSNYVTKESWQFFNNTGDPKPALVELAEYIDMLQAPITESPLNLPLSISFIPPTDPDGATISRNWTYVKVNLTGANTAFIDWNQSLAGLWRFDDKNSTHVFDNSTYKNHGAMKNGVNCDVAGKFGQACKFDGVNDYIDVPDKGNYDNISAITVEAWFKFEQLAKDKGEGEVIVTKKHPSSPWNSWSIGQWNGDNNIAFSVKNSAGTNFQAYVGSAATNILPGEWHHIVGVYNGSRVVVYLDGNIGSNSASMTGPIYNSTDPLRIGADWSGGSRFNGTIDEVKIWNRALSPEEIKASFNAGLYCLYRNFPNLANGTYNYKAYAQNLTGNIDQTETRTLTVNS